MRKKAFPDEFYKHIHEIAMEMLPDGMKDTFDVRKCIHLYQGKGIGYGKMTDCELHTLMHDIIAPTGILFDTCYSGKAINYLIRNIKVNPSDVSLQDPIIAPDLESSYANPTIPVEESIIVNSGDNVIFIHTGGTLALYEQMSQIQKVMSEHPQEYNKVQKLQLS